MTQGITKKDYMEQFQKTIDQVGEERAALTGYLDAQFKRLTQLTGEITEESFWDIFPEILGIDAKLTLLTDLIAIDDFSNEEIVRLVENDYLHYFKELCGYDLRTKTKPSMIFHLL